MIMLKYTESAKEKDARIYLCGHCGRGGSGGACGGGVRSAAGGNKGAAMQGGTGRPSLRALPFAVGGALFSHRIAALCAFGALRNAPRCINSNRKNTKKRLFAAFFANSLFYSKK